MKAVLRLVGVELPRPLVRREPYVTAIALSAATTSHSVPVAVGGRERELQAAPPEGAVAVATEPAPEGAEGADRSNLKLDLVLFEGDPGDWLLVRGSVMETDADYRLAGQRVDAARHVVEGTPLGAALAAGLTSLGPAAALADEAAKVVTRLLLGAGDDLLLDFEVRISGADGFRSHAREFEVSGPSCVARFLLEVEGLPEVAAPAKPAESDGAKAPEVQEKTDGTDGETKVEPGSQAAAPLQPPAIPDTAGVAVDSGEPVPVVGAVEPRELATGETLAEGEAPAKPAVPSATRTPRSKP